MEINSELERPLRRCFMNLPIFVVAFRIAWFEGQIGDTGFFLRILVYFSQNKCDILVFFYSKATLLSISTKIFL